ncbi:predicted protein [Chaetoceros tenuissimus]|uniref:Uncharacterized protein n=1 Tax=Chaetoceros tenuissimus TaxID=426638 RepID=A0AAD3CMU5_9STRA|nr:predicted protein [Chaetoceros tenuissimus]
MIKSANQDSSKQEKLSYSHYYIGAMGKKSKRRTGKRSQKKAVKDEQQQARRRTSKSPADENAMIGALDDSDESDHEVSDETIEACEAFMIWSLSDKADLTPKKFEKMAPGVAKMLKTGQFSIEGLLGWRDSIISKLEERLKEFELEKGIQMLMEEVNWKNEKEENEFLQELKRMYIDPHVNLLASFEHVAYESKESRKSSFDDCRFLKMSESEFKDYFMVMIPKLVNSEEATETEGRKLFQRYYFHPSARTQEPKDELQQLLSSLLSLYLEMKKCWECNE